LSEILDRKVSKAFRSGITSGFAIGIFVGMALSGLFDAIGWAW